MYFNFFNFFIKFQILLATLAAVANASSIYSLGALGQPIIRTGYSAPISALNAYPGAINAYAGAAIAAPRIYASAPIAAPIAAAPLAAPIINAVGSVSSQTHQQVLLTLQYYKHDTLVIQAAYNRGSQYFLLHGPQKVKNILLTPKV